MKYPLFKVLMSDIASRNTQHVLASGYIGEGEIVRSFEQTFMFGRYSPEIKALATNSCTSALDLAFRIVRSERGMGEVLTTPLTCLATTAAILHAGLHPKWVDINPDTLNIDLYDLTRKYGRLTQGLCLVYFGGRPIDLLDRTFELEQATWQGMPMIVEDRAQAFGSRLPDPYDFACYSFQAVKTLTTGDGGMLLTKQKYYERAKKLRWFGLDRDLPRDQNVKEIGYKCHMNDITASIGLANYDVAWKAVQQQKENARFYHDQLTVRMPKYHDGCAYPFFPVLVERKDQFIRHLAAHGIESTPAHYRNDKHDCVRNYQTELPGMDEVEQKMTCIPSGWWIDEAAREHIVNVIKKGW